MNLQRLCELAGIDGARDLQAQGPMNDRGSTSHNFSKSWEDGQDEFNPLVQDNQEDHRIQGIEAFENAVNALINLKTFISTQNTTTNPKFNQMSDEVDALSATLSSTMDSMSFPAVDAPRNSASGTQRDPTNQW